MKIVTYNVNGIRSAIGKGLCDWIADERPDVLCLQETKAQPEQIPSEAFERMGYRCHYFSAVKKGYSGVAILTLREPDRVVPGMGIERYDSEGRFLRADYGDLSVVSVYHPSGTSGDERQAFKMRWLDDFSDYVSRLLETRPKLILCGDFNICHRPIDIHDPVRNATVSGFLPEDSSTRSGSFIRSRTCIRGGASARMPGQTTRAGGSTMRWPPRPSGRCCAARGFCPMSGTRTIVRCCWRSISDFSRLTLLTRARAQDHTYRHGRFLCLR